MTDNTAEAEELLQQAKEQSRKDTEPAAETDSGDTPALEDAIAEAYQSIDDGDLSSNLTLRDDNLAALFHGLEAAGQLSDVGDAAAAKLGRDDGDTRAGALRNLVRIGLQEVDESVIESGKEGRRRFLDSDEF